MLNCFFIVKDNFEERNTQQNNVVWFFVRNKTNKIRWPFWIFHKYMKKQNK